MELENFRINKIDEFNYVIEEKKIKVKDGQKVEEWKRHRGFFGTLQLCLNALKEYVIGIALIDSKNADELIKKIDELNNAIVRCNFKIEGGI